LPKRDARSQIEMARPYADETKLHIEVQRRERGTLTPPLARFNKTTKTNTRLKADNGVWKAQMFVAMCIAILWCALLRSSSPSASTAASIPPLADPP